MENKIRKTFLTLLAITLLICGCSGKSKELEVSPASDILARPANLAWWSRAAIDALMRYSAWSGAHSGSIALIARNGVPVYSNVAGWKDIASEQPMTLDTPVRIASMTKPITAVAAMILVEEGKLGLDDPVADYLPEFAQLRIATSDTPNADGVFPSAPASTVLTVRHLLTFSSGIGPGRDTNSLLVTYWDRQGIYEQPVGDLGDRVTTLAQMPLFEEPGTRWRYGFSLDVLARIIELISGQSISDFTQERILQPLGMKDTGYLSPATDRDALATVYTQDKDGKLINAPLTYDAKDWTPGGGGFVSTAADYMRFALMLWNGGEYQGVRILRQETVDNMRRLHVPDGVLVEEDIQGMGWGLGMAVVADEDLTITPDRNGDFWWSGYLGTTFFVSPETGLVGVVLSQNEPSKFSGLPFEIFVIQGLAFAGL
jgi:CubicO group peptidase (beta-lactamase class C family)